MAKLKRSKSFKKISGTRKNSRGKKQRMGLINTGIAVMSLLLVAFIFSFSGRQTQSGIPIEVKFPSLPDTQYVTQYIQGKIYFLIFHHCLIRNV